jgi:serine/threonine protein kinase/WD40 repeat protein
MTGEVMGYSEVVTPAAHGIIVRIVPPLAIDMPEPIDPTRTGDFPAEPPTATDYTRSHDRNPATATADPTTGLPTEPLEVLPGFDILRELGSGGMGVVYEARQTRLNRLVALKVLRGGRGDAKDMVRFLAEAEAVAAIRHPHVVQVYETGQDTGRPYMALELLTGGTLADRLKAGKLDPRDAAALVAKLADAVRAAHELGIVHRDLKPSNILFRGGRGQGTGDSKTAGPDGSSLSPVPCPLSPVITDFGLAKRAGGVDLTRTQAVMGTPAYMAPEQARGDTKFVGPAADVWALGAILYECLTGKRPFDADDTFAILRKVMDESPPRPRDHVPGLPRDLELIALKCLEKSPADRYPSAAALAEDLERFLAGKPVSVRPAGPTERFVKWVRRNPVVAGATAAVALALVAGSAVSLAFGLEARRRGEELAKSNDELGRTNTDLTKSRNDLAGSMKDVERAQGDAEARGYLSDVALAHQLWKANDLAGMHAALERCPADRRKWEWHYLKGLSRPERAQHTTDSPPLALAYSPDGKLLAYSTLAGTLVVRDREAEKDRHIILGKADQSNRHASIAFHPRGGELAYVTSGRVRVVDLVTGKWRELKDPSHPDGNPGNFNGHPSIAVGYTPDGTLLAAAVGNGKKTRTLSFAIRDAVTGKPISTCPCDEELTEVLVELASATFSPDGKLFAVSLVDSGIRVRGENKPATEVPTYSPRVRLWDVKSGKFLQHAGVGSALFGGIAFDPESRSVGFGRRGQVGELDPKPDVSPRMVPAHTGDVLAVAFDRSGLIWSGGEDKMILAHDRTTGSERFALRGCSRDVLRLAVSPDGKEIAAAVGDLLGPGGAVYRFDASTLGADAWRNPAKRDRLSLVAALDPDGSRFAACDCTPFDDRPETFRFSTRNLADGKQRNVTPAGQWFRGAFAPDGRLFVMERKDPRDEQEQVRVIEADGRPSHVIALPAEPESIHHLSVVACAPDGRTLAVVTGQTIDRTKLGTRLHTWDAATRELGVSGEVDLSALLPPKVRFPGLYPLGVAIDRDSKRLAATFAANWEVEGQTRFESRGAVVVWDLTTGKELVRKYTAEPLHAAAFDPQGRLAVAGGSQVGGIVFGWDIQTKAEFLSLRSHTRPILALVFGPDNRLVTGGADRVVKVWDLESKREVLTLDGFAREVTHLAFTKDGKNLVAATGIDMLAAMSAGGTPTDWPPAEVRVFRGAK